jgi:hypothetical protein
MMGVIRKREILSHPLVTIRSFGVKVFFKAVFAPREQTFLSLLIETNVLPAQPMGLPELVGRCIDLELQAMYVYETLAGRFTETEAVHGFLATLASQERGHAELLRLCRAAATRGGWHREHLNLLDDVVPRVEDRLREVRSCVDSVTDVAGALRLVLKIESSEINLAFARVVAASDSEFVRNLEVFRHAGQKHLTYICQRGPKICPELREECGSVWAARENAARTTKHGS